MKHKIGFNRLSRTPAHRKALHRNMVTSLFKYERITTTKQKALEIRRTAEKMITRAKIDSVHNRRIIARNIQDSDILAKLFKDIGPRMKDRPGGYTRILKLGFRRGDAADMVLLELVDFKDDGKKEKREERKASRRAKEDARREAQEAAAEKAEAEAPKASSKE
jgi:large subunit ribosomal protein L17